VLVTHVRTPFPPAVGLRSCVRMRVPSCLFTSGQRHSSCCLAGRRSRRRRGPAPASPGAVAAGCDDVRSRAARLALTCSASACDIAVWRGKNQLTQDVPGDKPLLNSDVKASWATNGFIVGERNFEQWGEDDVDALKTIHRHHTQPCHNQVITLHVCLACQCSSPCCA
jgi:hypothetical protein